MIRSLFEKRAGSYRGNKFVLLLTSVLTWSLAVSPAALSWGAVGDPVAGGVPVVNGVNPAEGVNAGIANGVTITGQGFASGMTARLVGGGGAVIPGTNLQLIDATQVRADFDLTGVAAGSWDVVVEVPVTKDGASLPAGLSSGDAGGAWNAREPLVDLSGNNNTLISNNARMVSDAQRPSYEFDGRTSQQYVSDPSFNIVDHPGGFAVEAWVKPDNSGEFGYGRIFDKRSENRSGMTLALGASSGSAMNLNAIIEHSGGKQQVSTVGLPVTKGVWSHVALVYNGTGSKDIAIYVNGERQALNGMVNASGSLRDDRNDRFVIGNRQDGYRHYDGMIGPVRFWKKALSGAQVAGLYDQTKSGWMSDASAPVTEMVKATLTSGLTVKQKSDEPQEPPVTGPVAKLEISGLPQPIEAGKPVGLTVTAKDADGNTVTGYTGTVRFTTNDGNPQTSIPQSYTFTAADAGQKTFDGVSEGQKFVFTKAQATTTLRVEDAGNGAVFAEQNGIIVTPDKANALRFLTPQQTAVPASQPSAPITVGMQDRYGNAVKAAAGGQTVHLSTDSTSTDTVEDGGSTDTPGGTGKTYYISSSTGNNANDGLSPSTPFKTFNGAGLNAKGRLKPGDTVLFKRGDVWIGSDARVTVESAGNAENWITIGAYGNESEPDPVLRASVTAAQMGQTWKKHSGSIYYVDGVSWYPNWALEGEKVPLVARSGTGDMSAGTSYYSSSQQRLYVWCSNGGHPDTQQVYIPTNDNHATFEVWQGAKYIHVNNITVKHSRSHNFRANDDYVYFTDCLADWAGGAGFYWFHNWPAPYGADYGRAVRCTARHGNVWTSQGFTIEGAYTWLYDCVAEFNYMAGIDFLDYSANTNVHDSGAIRCITQKNGLRPNSYDANLYVDGGRDVWLIDCISYDAGGDTDSWHPGIAVHNEHESVKQSKNIHIINCLSYGSKDSALDIGNFGSNKNIDYIYVYGSTFQRGPDGFRTLIIRALDNAKFGIDFRNNIVDGMGTPVIAWAPSYLADKYHGDNNVFYLGTGSGSSGKLFNTNSTGDTGLAGWRSFTGEDKNSIEGNPLFVSDGSRFGGFFLSSKAAGHPADSPARNCADESWHPIAEYDSIGTTCLTGASDETSNMDAGFHYKAVYRTDIGGGGSRTVSAHGFSKTGSSPWDATSVVIPEGAVSVDFYYMDAVTGTYTIGVADEAPADDNAGLSGATQSLSIVEPAAESVEAAAAPAGGVVARPAGGAASVSASETPESAEAAVEEIETDASGETSDDGLSAYAESDVETGEAPLSVTFTGSGSPSSDVVRQEWDFEGDGSFEWSTSTAVTAPLNVSYTYRSAGTYPATLRVTDVNGHVATYVLEIDVTRPEANPNGLPTAEITMAEPDHGALPLAVSFSAAAEDDGEIVSYRWDFDGDGRDDVVNPAPEDITWMYTVPGLYPVRLTVVDDQAQEDTAEVFVLVGEAADMPGATIETSSKDRIGQAPFKVTFKGTATGGAKVQRYDWDFDADGVVDTTTDSAAPVSYTFGQPGTYESALTVTDAEGRAATATVTVRVGAGDSEQAPESDFDVQIAGDATDDPSGKVPLEVTCVSTARPGDQTIRMYEWDFDGDGRYEASGADLTSVTHTYGEPGTGIIRLKVTDQRGLSDTHTVFVTAQK